MKKFYTKKEINIPNKTKSIDVHLYYKEFKKGDSISWLRIFIGLNLLFWVKLLLIMLVNLITISLLKLVNLTFKEDPNSPTRRNFMKILSFAYGGSILLLIGVIPLYRREGLEKVYKKYLGENYEINFEDNFSTVISNHNGWIDIFIHVNKFATGFLAKAEVKSTPVLGTLAKEINCLFVNRGDETNRQNILNEVKERQKQIINKVSLTPLSLFPEGTVTNGNYVLRFKKGAFASLLPVKPMCIKGNNKCYELAMGSTDTLFHMIYAFFFLYNTVEVLELPVITPNEFMYTNYVGDAMERWEIYAEVAREIICEAGNLQKTEKTFRDGMNYHGILNGNKKLYEEFSKKFE